MASMPVMTFIETDKRFVVATFSQAALKFVHVDDTAEIAFNRLPGEIVSARVQSILPGTGQGQLPPSGTLMEFTTNPVPGRFPVLLELDDSKSRSLPAGASGVAAIYTSHAQKIQIIRKVVIRMTSWLNYIIR
jgi:multidrug resistance efflux pump